MSTTKPENRKQLLDMLGATQKNVQWSWCAVDDTNKRVFFSIWEQEKLHEKNRYDTKAYLIQQPWWGVDENLKSTKSRNDHNEKLRLYFECGYSAYGYILKRKRDSDGNLKLPVEIGGVCDFIFHLDLIKVPRLDLEGYMHELISQGIFETDFEQEFTTIGIVRDRISRSQFYTFKYGKLTHK
ncbi:hypothetical protein OTK59_12350 [Vibrio natriegens]|uniref:hypothetical protein n=1 Tax=Vibrio natriegens TaxID=691 RepID=UPI0022849021|nr:hypothetical protein [Vibrio natriegens]MCY9877347.1 hypothetical protein [Vibrio natriegens]HCG5592894.1 hypothetical protein [Vibrio parahaemolyticus]